MVDIDIKAGHVFACAIGMLFVGLLQLGQVSPGVEMIFMIIAGLAAFFSGLWLTITTFG
jgi:hypothetical protein